MNRAPTMSEALASLEESIAFARLHEDPMAVHMEAVREVVVAQHDLYDQLQEAARSPVRSEELRAAVAAGVSTHARAMVTNIRWGVRVAAAGVVLVGLISAAGTGYFLGHRAGQADGEQASVARLSNLNALQAAAERSGADGPAAWRTIIENNRIADVIAGCKVTLTDGRKTCSPALWVEPAPAATKR